MQIMAFVRISQRYLTLPRHELGKAFVLEHDGNAPFAEKLYSSDRPS